MKTLLLLTFLLVAFAGLAHPPKEVVIKYEAQTGELKVVAEHSVKNPQEHYIKSAAIFVNGKKKTVIKAKNQATNNEAFFTYQVGSLKTGDVVKVFAKCNKPGGRSSEIVIE